MISMMMYGAVLYATVTTVLWHVVLGVHHTGGGDVLPEHEPRSSFAYQ